MGVMLLFQGLTQIGDWFPLLMLFLLFLPFCPLFSDLHEIMVSSHYIVPKQDPVVA